MYTDRLGIKKLDLQLVIQPDLTWLDIDHLGPPVPAVYCDGSSPIIPPVPDGG